MKRENIIFIIVVALLCTLALVGGIWAVNRLQEKDEAALNKLVADYAALERIYYDEIQKIDDRILTFPNPDSVRTALYDKYKTIRRDKQALSDEEKKKAVLEKLDDFHKRKESYQKSINEYYDYKDGFTANEISSLKEMVEMYKTKLDQILAQNSSLVRRLNILTSKLKGAEAQLADLQDSKMRLDSLMVEQEQARSALDDVNNDRDRLQELLNKSEELVKRQREEIERLKGLTRKAYNFTAEYEYKKRKVALDPSGKHTRAQVDKYIEVTFTVGEGLFDDAADENSRVVYLTLFFEGQPYRIINERIRVDKNNQVLVPIQFDDRLEKGNYFFRLTYQEKSIMDDYKFVIQ
ncbi:MAG: hypothetical protein ACFCUI_02835 [Bernardetiaceae bacterium]